jgi:hypothetical protein
MRKQERKRSSHERRLKLYKISVNGTQTFASSCLRVNFANFEFLQKETKETKETKGFEYLLLDGRLSRFLSLLPSVSISPSNLRALHAFV